MESGSSPPPIDSAHFDIGFDRHSPPPSRVEKGSPWDSERIDEEEPLAPLDQWWQAGNRNPHNRFFKPLAPNPHHESDRHSRDPDPNAVPARRQPSRASTQRKGTDMSPGGDVFEEAVKPILDESDLSDEEGAFVPPPDDNDTDDSDHSDRPTMQPSTLKSRGKRKATQLVTEDADDSDEGNAQHSKSKPRGKGKGPQRNASAGPSDFHRGRPTVETNQEIERVGHRIQGELVALAEKVGLSYDTLLRKVGLSHQGVREPTMGNIFRKVHKQRLLASGEGMY